MRLVRLKADFFGRLIGEEVHGRAGELFLVFDDTAEALLKTSYFSQVDKKEERRILRSLFKPYGGESLEGKSLLLFFGSAFGDSLVMLPVLRRIKELYPTCKLYITVRPFETHFYYGVSEVSLLLNRMLNLKELPKVDYVVDFSGMSGDKDFLELGMQQYYCKRLFLDWQSLNPKHYKVAVNPYALRAIEPVVKELRKSRKKLLLVCPKSPAWVRRFSNEFLKELPKKLKGYTLLIAQPSDERELNLTRLEGWGYVSLTHYMTHLDYFKALVSLVDVVLSVDTGCFHLAGSFEKPVVGVFNTFECAHRNYYPKALCYQVQYSGPLCTAPCKLSFVPATEKNPKGMCQSALINPTFYKDAPPCMYSINVEEILKLIKQAQSLI